MDQKLILIISVIGTLDLVIFGFSIKFIARNKDQKIIRYKCLITFILWPFLIIYLLQVFSNRNKQQHKELLEVIKNKENE